MKDRVFIDTNIIVYGIIEKDVEKHNKVKELFESLKNKEVFISIQIVNEVYSALTKNKIEHERIEKYINELNELFNIEIINFETVKKAMNIKKKYGYSYWDSLVLSSAIENHCSIVYSEDMQNSQIIEKKIRIVNPFLE